MKKRSDKRPRLQGVTLGQTFQDTWHYADGDKSAQDLLAAAAVRYTLTGEEPTGDERARIGSGWGGVKCEIGRIREQTDTATDAFANGEGERERESDIEQDGERESEGAGDSPAPRPTPAEHPSILDFERESKLPDHLDRKEAKAVFREVVWAFFREEELLGFSDEFLDYYDGHGWPRGRDWRGLARTWAKREMDMCPEYQNEKTRPGYLRRHNAFYRDPERWARYCAIRNAALAATRKDASPEAVQTDATPAPATPSSREEVHATPVSASLDPVEAEPEHRAELSERPTEVGVLAEEESRAGLSEEAEDAYEDAYGDFSRFEVVDGYRIPRYASLEEEAAAFRAYMEKQNAAHSLSPSPLSSEPITEPSPTATQEPPQDLSHPPRDKSCDKSRKPRDKSAPATPRAKDGATRRPPGRRPPPDCKKRKG